MDKISKNTKELSSKGLSMIHTLVEKSEAAVNDQYLAVNKSEEITATMEVLHSIQTSFKCTHLITLK